VQFDEREISRLKAALASGVSPSLVAKRFGISTMAIYRLKLSPKRKKVRKPKKQERPLFSPWNRGFKYGL
jgi:hypothetical protein